MLPLTNGISRLTFTEVMWGFESLRQYLDNLERRIIRMVGQTVKILPCHGQRNGFDSRTIRLVLLYQMVYLCNGSSTGPSRQRRGFDSLIDRQNDNLERQINGVSCSKAGEKYLQYFWEDFDYLTLHEFTLLLLHFHYIYNKTKLCENVKILNV